ncbi:hypothetical protein P153DRAFT_355088 [Dothidotthia symphoricarpi CBS 119687]|uniref:Uncharacterized protein n=1 Tax=Dothidotthia symphoricarpi CBS 119687 TaxID=1392245 RepID=A0A6A6AJH1_9PLEO|nr:uncharacterized protein P153DRAFT_355088 [Dothidotthia symphoricarpi CBS 119687]KAF2131258.1 hypothetical protein P153DRAFT_355088 [Dothidotthia symphoricarpi CBS 119687]
MYGKTDVNTVEFSRRTIEAMQPNTSPIVARDIVMDVGHAQTEDVDVDESIFVVHHHAYTASLGHTDLITRLNVGIDLQMLVDLNAFEGTSDQYVAVFEKVDSRFGLGPYIQTVRIAPAEMKRFRRSELDSHSYMSCYYTSLKPAGARRVRTAVVSRITKVKDRDVEDMSIAGREESKRWPGNNAGRVL